MSAETFPPDTKTSPTCRRVLVAADGVTRAVVRRVLSDYEVVEARDGREALDVLEASQNFECILTDDNMPQASGFEIAEHVRASQPLRHIPVVLMTAKITSARQVKGARVGAAAFLNKPFTVSQLQGLVDLMSRVRPDRRIA
jgi:CheY-like chemotaxis protein